MSKQKLAILGGGIGAMTSAFYLTSQPGWKERFDITVYQLGWRLGGKGASGRNQEIHDRIEEHGFHIFFGYYENAFATMRALYGELGRNPNVPLATWDEAWKPWSWFALYQTVAGEKVPWVFEFPRNADTPGDGGLLPSWWSLVKIILGWAKQTFGATHDAPSAEHMSEHWLAAALARLDEQRGAEAHAANHDLRHILHTITKASTAGAHDPTPNTFLHLAHAHAERLADDPSRHSEHDHSLLLWLLRHFIAWLREHWREVALDIQRVLILLDLAITTVIGMIVDELIVPPVDWFKIDGTDFETWLRKHGATETAVNSPPIQLIKMMNFAEYQGGMGAGSSLVFMLRVALTYKGAFAWRMQAGMGDTIFAPFYEVLRRRGVKFEFFQSVEELGVGSDDNGAPVVDTITIGTQMKVKGGTAYQPLLTVKGLPCWPSKPLYDQLERGEELRASGENLENWWGRWKNAETRVLQRGKDFDLVVLGVSIGAYPYIAKQLIDNPATPQFRTMVESIRVTETLGVQLWLTPNTAAMGWTRHADPILGTYYEPCNTVADMSYLIPRESWPEGMVGGIQYLCAGLDTKGEPPELAPRDDHAYPFRQAEYVKRSAGVWLDRYTAGLWPTAVQTDRPTELNWWLLADKHDAPGRARYDSQFWIAEWNPSDRYVLSVPGSVYARLPAAGTGYANLLMGGDWVLTGLSQGCVEAAVMAGMHVSRALTGYPKVIVGDHEPDGGDVPPAPPLPPRRAGRYVEYDGNDTPMQPYVATGTTMYNFVLEADLARLQAICDQRLNLGGPTIYKPLGPFLSFVAAPIAQITATQPQAWKDEQDFGFWIPVLAGREVGGQFLVDRPAFFIPYLWVDNYLPQQSGREVFGYPKGVGRLVNPSSPDDAAEFSIDALVVPEYGYAPPDRRSMWQWQRLLTAARRGGGKWGDRIREFESMAALAEAVIAQITKAFQQHHFDLPTLKLLRALFDDAKNLDVPMVYLKQFRDVADGTRACYQAIVESPNQMAPGLFKAGWLAGDWELTIAQFASVKLIDDLGLRVVDGKVTSVFHFWSEFNFTAANGKVVWRGA